MKISLTLDDKLIAQATIALDAATHADAIILALQRVVRKYRYEQILASRGTLYWADDSAERTGSLADIVGVLSPAKATVTTEELCAPVSEKKAKK